MSDDRHADDRHAEDRDRKRHKGRYGHTATNPGMRVIMRDLAQKDRDRDRDAHRPEEDEPTKERPRQDR